MVLRSNYGANSPNSFRNFMDDKPKISKYSMTTPEKKIIGRHKKNRRNEVQFSQRKDKTIKIIKEASI